MRLIHRANHLINSKAPDVDELSFGLCLFVGILILKISLTILVFSKNGKIKDYDLSERQSVFNNDKHNAI